MTQIILTSGSSWTVPSDWNNASNIIECIGSGANGNTTSSYGGGGGAYAKGVNLSLTPGSNVAIQIGVPSTNGAVARTSFFSVPVVIADGATSNIGGLASGSSGAVTYSGGSGYAGQRSGGGGAAGPNGAGVSSTAASSAGGSGDAGFGGAGGAYTSSAAGGPGGNGTEWVTAGSGGGGAGAGGSALNGGNGGTYGGGGGGASGGGGIGGTASGGLIVITYTPANSTAVGNATANLSLATGAATVASNAAGNATAHVATASGYAGDGHADAVGNAIASPAVASGIAASLTPSNAVANAVVVQARATGIAFVPSNAVASAAVSSATAHGVGGATPSVAAGNALANAATGSGAAAGTLPPQVPGAPLSADRVQETSTSVGTGSIALDGAANPGMSTFGANFGTGRLCGYVALNLDNSDEWERGIGTYSADTNVIARTHITGGSNGTAPVNFSAGPKLVMSVQPAASTGAAYSATQVYTPGDTVTDGTGAMWYSVTVNTGSPPATDNPDWKAVGGGGSGSGTVTSVAQTVPPWLAVAGSPITGAGTLAITAASGQPANKFLAAPNGSSGPLALRSIVGADLPTSGASAGTYGDATHVGAFTVDATGRVTSASNIPVTGAGGLTGVVSVTDYGASPSASAATNTAAFNQAIQAGLTQGAIVWVPGGTYTVNTIVVYSHTKLVGAGTQQTSLFLASGTNSDLIQGYQARSLFGTNSSGGTISTTVRGMLLDANRAGNSAGCGIAIYGWGTVLADLWVQNAAEHGIWSEAGSTSFVGSTQLPFWEHVVAYHNGKHGINYGGQHDGVMYDVEPIGNSLLATNTYDNFHFYGDGSCRLIACHPWSDTLASNQAVRYACYIGTGAVSIIGGDYEGGWSANLYIDAGQSGFTQVSGMPRFYANATNASVVINSPTIFDGAILSPYGSAVSTGIKLNDAAGKFCSDSIISAVMYGQATGVDFTYAGPANRVVVRGYFPDGSNAIVGAPSTDSSVDVVIGENSGTQISYQIPGGGTGGSGVISFNGRTGVVTLSSADVTSALGGTPVTAASNQTITGAWTFANQLSLTGANARVAIQDYNGGSAVGRIFQNANVTNFSLATGAATFGINTGNGNAYTTQTFTCTSLVQTSDRKLKRNIKPKAPRPLHQSVPFSAFEWKHDGSASMGIIAQDVQAVAPEYVEATELDGGPLGVNIGKLALEEANWAANAVDALIKRVEALEGRKRKPS